MNNKQIGALLLGTAGLVAAISVLLPRLPTLLFWLAFMPEIWGVKCRPAHKT